MILRSFQTNSTKIFWENLIQSTYYGSILNQTFKYIYIHKTSDSALPIRIIVFFQIKNLQASRDKAPICVVAPHSTIIDPFVIIMCYGVPVVKKSMSEIPLMGTIGKLMQIVFFDRETASQRNEALKAIKVNIDNPKKVLI